MCAVNAVMFRAADRNGMIGGFCSVYGDLHGWICYSVGILGSRPVIRCHVQLAVTFEEPEHSVI
jgi:hypothetical protein